MVDDNLYKQTFDAAIKELSELMEEREGLDSRREELNNRITKVRSGVLALSPLIGAEPQSIENKYPHLFPDLIPPDIGLTDAVRQVLVNCDGFMGATAVRTELRAMGYDVDRYKNILASIHTILKRLVDANEVEAHEVGNITVYQSIKKGTPWVSQGSSGHAKPVDPPESLDETLRKFNETMRKAGKK